MSILLKPRKIKKYSIKKDYSKISTTEQYKALDLDSCKRVTCVRGYSFDRRISYKLAYGNMNLIYEMHGRD